MLVCVFLSSLSTHCHIFPQMYFLVAVLLFFSLSLTVLWTCCERIQLVSYWDRISQSSLSTTTHPPPYPHSLSGPVGMQTRCSWWFLLWAELRYSVIYDWAFSSFWWTSSHSPWSHVRIWEPQNADRFFFFFIILSDSKNSRHSFHLWQPYFVILSSDFPLSLSPTPFLYFQ